jgi:hypothetical protein
MLHDTAAQQTIGGDSGSPGAATRIHLWKLQVKRQSLFSRTRGALSNSAAASGGGRKSVAEDPNIVVSEACRAHALEHRFCAPTCL